VDFAERIKSNRGYSTLFSIEIAKKLFIFMKEILIKNNFFGNPQNLSEIFCFVNIIDADFATKVLLRVSLPAKQARTIDFNAK
jgi:hypothetical protein